MNYLNKAEYSMVNQKWLSDCTDKEMAEEAKILVNKLNGLFVHLNKKKVEVELDQLEPKYDNDTTVTLKLRMTKVL